MPRYYFHVHDGKDFPDLQGTVLPSVDAAKSEAVRFMADLLAHNPDGFWSGGEWTMHVTDARDVELFELKFSTSMKPEASYA